MDVNVVVNNEIEIDSSVLIETLVVLQQRYTDEEIEELLPKSNLFIYGNVNSKTSVISLVPKCDCESCSKIAKAIKKHIRENAGNFSEENEHIDLTKDLNG